MSKSTNRMQKSFPIINENLETNQKLCSLFFKNPQKLTAKTKFSLVLSIYRMANITLSWLLAYTFLKTRGSHLYIVVTF